MAKCGGCGKFLAANEGIKCKKCPGTFHRICVNLPASGAISPSWICPGCKAKIPREDNTHTPVKAVETNNGSSAIATQPETHSATQPEIQSATQPETQSATKPETQSATPSKGSCMLEAQEFIGLAKEIRSLREEVTALRSEIREFREEMASLKESVKTCGDRVDTLESRVNSIEEKFEHVELRSEATLMESPRLVELQTTIEELKQQLNEREQESIQNDVQLSGITEVQGENPNQILRTLAVKFGLELDERDVVFAKRVGSVLRERIEGESPRPRIIVVRLARRAMRDSMLAAARVRRGFTTADLQLPGAANRIFINERLTKINRQLFYLTRQAASRLEWKYAWTKDGRILARKEEGKAVVHIRTEADIERFFVSN